MLTPDVDALCRRMLEGDRRALARLISRVETSAAEAEAILNRIYPPPGRLHVCGLTGPPGAGKSSLVWLLAGEFAAAGLRVAVLAVDPSSPVTGGALLGDRVRQPAASDGIYFRSMSNRARPGALTPPLRDVLTLLDAAGFDIAFVETVGAGQADVGIQTVAHTVLVVQVPGLGDDVQALKAGMLEIGDIFVVNKSDLVGADALALLLRQTMDLAPDPGDGWRPPVVQTSVRRGTGIAELAEQVSAHRRWLMTTNRWQARRALHAEEALREAVTEQVQAIAREAAQEQELWNAHLEAVQQGKMTPRRAARELIAQRFSLRLNRDAP